MKFLLSEKQYKNLIGLIKEVSVTNLPKKAELVKDNLSDFYKTLESAAEKGGLKQQPYGDMTYKKEVESLQIALVLLDYELPIHGIDGLFGPETAKAVEKFIDDHKIEDK